MKAFKRSRGMYVAEFEPEEAQMLSALAAQVSELLEDGSVDDPAVLRLLPDAYPDDSDASAEFRRFTSDELSARKTANASRVVEDLAVAAAAASVTKVAVGVQAAQSWLRTLTDIRLTLATRLGIVDDDDQGSGDEALLDLYDWLGFVQGSLIDCVDR